MAGSIAAYIPLTIDSTFITANRDRIDSSVGGAALEDSVTSDSDKTMRGFFMVQQEMMEIVTPNVKLTGTLRRAGFGLGFWSPNLDRRKVSG